MHHAPSIVLVGLKHVGKSTLARIAARTLDVETSDTDELIVEIAGDEADARSVYRARGKNEFMRLETLALERALRGAGDTPRILSTGGGIADNLAALSVIRASGSFVLYLHEKPLVLYERVRERGIPAFLDPERPREHFLELAAARDRVYRSLADAIVLLDGLPTGEAATRLITEIRRIHAG